MVGPIVIGISMMLLGFTVSVAVGIVAAGVYLVQHLFEAYWLYPKVMNRAMSISTGSVVVAIIIGGALLGVTGALMAVPVAAAIQLIIREVVFPMQDRPELGQASARRPPGNARRPSGGRFRCDLHGQLLVPMGRATLPRGFAAKRTNGRKSLSATDGHVSYPLWSRTGAAREHPVTACAPAYSSEFDDTT